MANLLDTIKTGSNSLAKQSQEETQQLAKKAGQIVPPMDPAAAVSLGATPMQAAMTGSSANIGSIAKNNAALAEPGKSVARQGQSQVGQKSERQSERTFTGQRAANSAELAKQELANKVSGLRFLGAGVQNAFDSALASGQSANETVLTPEKSFINTNPALSSKTPAEKTEAEAIIRRIGEGTANNSDLLRVGSLMGIENQSQLATLTDSIRKKMFDSAEAQTGTITAGGIKDKISFSDIDKKSMQAAGLDEIALANELNIDINQLAAMTPEQLSSSLRAVTESRYNRTIALQDILRDPLASNEERLAASKGLQELGASGISSTERKQATTSNLVDAGAFVTTPTGEILTAEEALSDDSIKVLAGNALMDPAKMAELEAKSPALADFIKKNAAVVQEAFDTMDTDVKTFESLQNENKTYTQDSGVSATNWDKVLGISPDRLSDQSFRVRVETDFPGAGYLINNPNPTVKAGLNAVMDASKTAALSLAKANPVVLQTEGLNTTAGLSNYKAYADNLDTLENVVTQDMPDSALLSIMGVPDGERTFNAVVEDNKVASAFGGAIFSAEVGGAKAFINDLIKPGGNAVVPGSGHNWTSSSINVSDALNKIGKATQNLPPEFSRVANDPDVRQFLKTGSLSVNDATTLANMGPGNIQSLLTLEKNPRTSGAAKTALDKKANELLEDQLKNYDTSYWDTVIGAGDGGTFQGSVWERAANYLNGNEGLAFSDKINASMQGLAGRAGKQPKAALKELLKKQISDKYLPGLEADIRNNGTKVPFTFYENQFKALGMEGDYSRLKALQDSVQAEKDRQTNERLAEAARQRDENARARGKK